MKLKMFVPILLIGIFFMLAFTSQSGGEAVSSPTTTQVQVKPKVVKQVVNRPKTKQISIKRFVPWGEPTISQVHQIIDIESHGSAWIRDTLERRINCESGFRWWASNGQYQGLGQFASSTFYRGVSSIGSKLVEMPGSSVHRFRHPIVIRIWSDGTRTKTKGEKRIRVTFQKIYRGWLPANPPVTHGWTQVRIMRQAIEGTSAVNNSEWECQ